MHIGLGWFSALGITWPRPPDSLNDCKKGVGLEPALCFKHHPRMCSILTRSFSKEARRRPPEIIWPSSWILHGESSDLTSGGQAILSAMIFFLIFYLNQDIFFLSLWKRKRAWVWESDGPRVGSSCCRVLGGFLVPWLDKGHKPPIHHLQGSGEGNLPEMVMVRTT
jgi:hypothetical protein